MLPDVSLKEAERRAWRFVFQDGLWDIFLGLLLLELPLPPMLMNLGIPLGWGMSIFVALVLLSALLLWAGKRFITTPRMGIVKFGPKEEVVRKNTLLIIAIAVLLGAVLSTAALVANSSLVVWLDPGLIFSVVYALGMLVIFGLGSYLLDYDRLWLVGVMYALPLPLSYSFYVSSGIELGYLAFVLPATVILLVGLGVFIRFLRDYPIPVENEFEV